LRAPNLAAPLQLSHGSVVTIANVPAGEVALLSGVVGNEVEIVLQDCQGRLGLEEIHIADTFGLNFGPPLVVANCALVHMTRLQLSRDSYEVALGISASSVQIDDLQAQGGFTDFTAEEGYPAVAVTWRYVRQELSAPPRFATREPPFDPRDLASPRGAICRRRERSLHAAPRRASRRTPSRSLPGFGHDSSSDRGT